MNKQMNTKNRSVSWGKRGIAYFLTFLVLMQNAMAVSAAVGSISNSTIERDLFNNPLFQRANLDSMYQYIESELAKASVLSDAGNSVSIKTLDDFVNQAKEENALSSIDQNTKHIGSPVVQARYIRYQVQGLLGRNLINGKQTEYASETAQLNTLYENALSYLADSSTTEKLGDPLNVDQEGGAPVDMIWPEVRVIHGEQVLVPIVYLTLDTISERQVADHHIEFGSEASFDDLVVENVQVRFDRDSFLRVAGDLENNGGEILAEENLNILVSGDLNNNEGLIHSDCGLNIETGGDTTNDGGTLSSGCDLKIVAGNNFSNLSGFVDATGNVVIGANSISNQTIVHRYDFGNKQGGSFGEIARINSDDGSVILRSYEDIDIIGGEITAGDAITLAAEGDIYVGGAKYVEGWQTDIDNYSSVEYLGSLLRAEGDITLNASGQIVVNGSDILSNSGHLEFLAGLGISVIDDVISESYELKIHGKNTKEITEYKTFAMRSILDAGKGIRMRTAFGDVTLRATDITTEEGTDITADSGGINLLLTKEVDHYRYFEERNSTFSTTVKNGGHDFDNIVQNTIIGGLSATALTGVHVEYEGNGDRSFEQQMRFFESVDNLKWIADLQNNPDIDVDWTEIEKVYEDFYESSTSLNAAAMAIITIVIAIVTAGAGAALIGAASNTTAAAVANVALTSLATTATLANINALVNGEGLLEATYAGLRAVGEKENLKNLAISMVTAGVMSAIDSQFFDAASETASSDSFLFDEVLDSATNELNLSLSGQALQAVTHATVRAGIQQAAYGTSFGDSFRQALVQSATSTLGKHMAGKIGDAFDRDDATSFDTALKYISHAAVGCVIGAASASVSEGVDAEDNCYAQGGGAVVGEFIGSQLRDREKLKEAQKKVEDYAKNKANRVIELVGEGATEEEIRTILIKEMQGHVRDAQRLALQGVQIARLSAAVGAFIAGADAAGINAAAEGAQNAAQYNALKDVFTDLKRELDQLTSLLRNPEGPFELLTTFLADSAVELGLKLDPSNFEQLDSIVSTVLPAMGLSQADFPGIDFSKPAVVGGLVAGLIDSVGIAAIFADVKLRQNLAPILGAEVNQATLERFGIAVEDTINLVVNADQILPSMKELLNEAIVIEDPRAQAEVARLASGIAAGTAIGVITGGAGLGSVASSILRSLSKLKSLSDKGLVSLNSVLDRLPFSVRFRESANSSGRFEAEIVPDDEIVKVLGRLPNDYLEAIRNSGFATRDIDKMYVRYSNLGIVKYIEDFAKNNPYGISLSEAHAIYGYTTDLFYSSMNKSIGTGVSHNGGALIEILQEGLSKLPNSNSVQYMGMGSSRSAPLDGRVVGDMVTFKPFQSAGDDITPGFWEDAHRRVTVVGSNAKDVSELSLFVQHADIVNPNFKRTPQESVFLPNSRFEILEIDGINITLRHIP